jgi:3-deoxy-D-manno-octulosonic acid kinase
MTHVDKFGPYLFGAALPLDHGTKERLFHLFEKPTEAAGEGLSGRTEPCLTDLPGVGAVVIKYYRRGGVIRHFNKGMYLRLAKSRPQREYEMLETVRNLGVSAPVPLLWAVRGRLFYRAFLVTRRIDDHRPLSDLGRGDPEHCRSAVRKTAGQINLLIENRIHHVDLHPGNVLLDKEGRVHIIDFDKARRVSWGSDKLRDAYVKRWKRAVEKYALPGYMTDQFIAGLGTSR